MTGWRFAIDRGGTFTDIVAWDPAGVVHTAKLLSASPAYADAASEGIARLARGAPVAAVRMGTTVATNALLERRGAPTCLVVTRGFRDALRIGHQARPRLFDRHIVLPEPLYDRVIEIDERVTAEGEVLTPLDEAAAITRLRAAFAAGTRAAAIVLMHGYRWPDHEVRLAALARAAGFTQISVGHDVAATIKLVPRGDTTVVDAYLSPVLRAHVDAVARGLRDLPGRRDSLGPGNPAGDRGLSGDPAGGRNLSGDPADDRDLPGDPTDDRDLPGDPAGYRDPPLPGDAAGGRDAAGGTAGNTPLHFMQSNGGLAAASGFRGKDAILSGPAGGVVGMVAVGRAAGFDRLIGFDMGGTSTDVSHYAGAFERATETVVAGVRIRTPMLAIDTVAAGGGSVCRWDGTRLRVGPASAGAVPGPAAYRNGGPLTVTDAQVFLGRLQPAYFPALFGATGDLPLDTAIVAARVADLAAETGLGATTLAEGFLDIAVATMARRVRAVSIERGHDVAGYTLVAMGGAAGQCACRVADALGIGRVLVSPFAGVLSALGIALADVRAVREATVEAAIDADVREVVARLSAAATAAVAAQSAGAEVAIVATALVKYAGTDTPLAVALDTPTAMAAAFAAQHRTRFGFAADAALVIDAVRIEAIAPSPAAGFAPAVPTAPPPAPTMVTMTVGGAATAVPLLDRAMLPAGWVVAGPAIVVDAGATTVVEPGWGGVIDAAGNLVMTRTAEAAVGRRGSGSERADAGGVAGGVAGVMRADAVTLELFAHRFMGIAEAMGVALQSTAASVNIKERLDFSCALFDGAGALVANAPHMPVHLGSMGESIAAVVRSRGESLRDGDAVMLNAPYNGGTHLPDITVIMPVFVDGTRAFFVAARGHHADIGGIAPGSMPANSTTIHEEGVLIDDFLLVDRGQLLEMPTRTLLASGRWPARDPDRNIGDLTAQVAACTRGASDLKNLCSEHGTATVAAYMAHVQDNAEAAVRRAIRGLNAGSFVYPLDNGAEIHVAVTLDRAAGTATVDFAGTSAQQPGNFNAPRSVVRAAVLYVFRCLIDDDIPLNDGCMRPINLLIPKGSMLDPAYPAAVVAGNVEVSQVVTDALFGALGAMAGSQGTMNNLTFGTDAWQYYETISGGSGAGPGFPGASAVQTHMTNSRLTDPEVLETRFPVLVDGFAVRNGSGGSGRWPGGDGTVRRLKFREAATASILSNRRRVPPFGLAGGGSGAPGRNAVERADGTIEPLDATATVALEVGNVLEIATPGGGGYGRPDR